jgi:hypothetical protein
VDRPCHRSVFRGARAAKGIYEGEKFLKYLESYFVCGVLVAILWRQAICILAWKAGRAIKKWIGGDEPGLGTSFPGAGWKCDLCGVAGWGDASSFFALSEIDHFLEAGCTGSLRPHDGLAVLKSRLAELKTENDLMQERIAAELAVISYAHERSRTPGQTTCLTGATGATGTGSSANGRFQLWVGTGQTLSINMAGEASRVQRVVMRQYPSSGAGRGDSRFQAARDRDVPSGGSRIAAQELAGLLEDAKS